MRFKPVFLLLAVLIIGLFMTVQAISKPSASALPNTILNTTVDMRAGSLDEFLLSANIRADEITKLVIVGDKYSASIGKKIIIEDKAQIAAIWKTYFRDAGSYNRFYGQGSRRLDIYTRDGSDKPAEILLIDPTDFTAPLSRVDKGFRCPGLEKWIRKELNKQKG